MPVFGPEKEDELRLQGLPAQSRYVRLEECQLLTPDRRLEPRRYHQHRECDFTGVTLPWAYAGHVVFFDDWAKLLISGDVIFKGGVGRSDFPRLYHN
ncbi:hypothetical protein ACLK1S_05740 [Escherichia coli]